MGEFKDSLIKDLKKNTKKFVDSTIDSVSNTLDKTLLNKEFRDGVKDKTKETAKKAADVTKNAAKKTKDKTSEVAVKTAEEVVKVLDQNGDGKLDVEDIIIMSLKTPGVAIDRANFLRKELEKNFDKETIDKAIRETPAKAGIPSEAIDKIAKSVITYERNCVTGISTALGIPGGGIAVATAAADIAQYYGYMLRCIQKLLYLYGFPEVDVKEKGQKFDSETLNLITLCLGVMYGVAGAKNAILVTAKALGAGVEKKLVNKALTKGIIYPIVKKVAKWFNVKMTKDIFAGFFKKAIPVVGGLIGGAITFVSFKPCCDRLQASLKETNLANPDAKIDENDKDIKDIINEVEYTPVEDDEEIPDDELDEIMEEAEKEDK